MSSLLTILAAGEPKVASAPSAYQASVRVEIAFNAGARTPASLYTWTDVTDYVELDREIMISWGRQDERSTADANQIGVVFDNRDGRFTAGNTTGPYGDKVLLDRPIRIIVDPVDGPEIEYGRGFLNELPVEWSDGTDATAYAPITASSRLSRLGYTANLKSLVETETLADAPSAYYTLGEAEGSTQANDSSGNREPSLAIVGDGTSPVVFGSATGPGTDSLTAAQFAAGDYLSGPAYFTPTDGFTLEAFTSVVTAPAAITLIAYLPGIDLALFVATTGKLGATVMTSGTTRSTVTSSADLVGGETHHAAVTWDGATLTLYMDGASQGSSAAGSEPLGPSTLNVGGGLIDVSTPTVGDNPVSSPLTGAVAHVAVYEELVSAARIATHAEAGLTGFAGDRTDERLERYAALAGIPAAEVNADDGNTTMVHIDTTDKQVVELMRTVETTEGGVLFDALDGTLTMHNRQRRYTAAGSSYTLNMAEQEVEVGYAPKYDRTGLANDVTASNTAGTIIAHEVDEESVEAHGSATYSIETASEDPDEPTNRAASWLYKFKDPKERAPSLTVDVLAQVGKTPSCATVLATTVGTRITVSNRPTQAATSSVDYFVEGGSLGIGHESMRLTLNLSPTAPDGDTLIIGDGTRGFIGTNPIAF